MNDIAIIIPLYKEFSHLAIYELISLRQLYRVLGKHNIYLIGPSSLQWAGYIEHAKSNNVIVRIKNFHPSFFRGLKGYNKLLLSKKFYGSFRKYDYMLIYQTDAFVFRDELDYWCGQGYDFIGAPWFHGWEQANEKSAITGIGNGGFSLRNIHAAIRLLNRVWPIKIIGNSWHGLRLDMLMSFNKLMRPFASPLKIKNPRDIHHVLLEENINEDYFWCRIVADIFSDYKLAPVEEATKFSFDANPSLLFRMNNGNLPFGCHAWQKYEPEFWSKYIELSGFADLSAIPENTGVY